MRSKLIAATVLMAGLTCVRLSGTMPAPSALAAETPGKLRVTVPTEQVKNRQEEDETTTWYFTEPQELVIDITDANLNPGKSRLRYTRKTKGVTQELEIKLTGFKRVLGGYRGSLKIEEGETIGGLAVETIDFAGNENTMQSQDFYTVDGEGPVVEVSFEGDIEQIFLEETRAFAVWKDLEPAAADQGGDVKITISVSDEHLPGDAYETIRQIPDAGSLFGPGTFRTLDDGTEEMFFTRQEHVAPDKTEEFFWALFAEDALGNPISRVVIKSPDGEEEVCASDRFAADPESMIAGSLIADCERPKGGKGSPLAFDGIAPAFYDEGIPVYSELPVFGFHAQDGAGSGLARAEVSLDDPDRVVEADPVQPAAGSELSFGTSEWKGTVPVSFVRGTSGENSGCTLKLTVTDRAGNRSEITQKFAVDTDAPRVRVCYENNESVNGKYFPKGRRLRITAEDLHMNLQCLDLVTQMSTYWRKTEAGYETVVDYTEDGNYTMALSVTDLAGNPAVIDYTDGGVNAAPNAFVIDTEPPVIRVHFLDAAGKGAYYREARTAIFDITEVNFDERLVNSEVSARLDGQMINGPVRSAFVPADPQIFDGRRRAQMTFAEDGEYELSWSVTDLAGNRSVTLTESRFVIDRTVPRIVIAGVLDHSANRGTVEPEIVWHDRNADPAQNKPELIRIASDLHEEAVKPRSSARVRTTVETRKLYDLPAVKENDGIYILTARAEDLAGNRVQSTILYSLNRFGSTYYTADATTGELVRQYYTRELPTIRIREVNPDVLTDHAVVLAVGNEAKRLKKGTDFAVTEIGGERRWKEYSYTIYPGNFMRAGEILEGEYLLTLRSTDAAGNENSNRTSDTALPVTFVIDRTPPALTIVGLSDGEVLPDAGRTVFIGCDDRSQIRSLLIRRAGKTPLEIPGTELDAAAGGYRLVLSSAEGGGTLYVEVTDAAGNTAVSQELHYSYEWEEKQRLAEEKARKEALEREKRLAEQRKNKEKKEKEKKEKESGGGEEMSDGADLDHTGPAALGAEGSETAETSAAVADEEAGKGRTCLLWCLLVVAAAVAGWMLRHHFHHQKTDLEQEKR